LYGKEFNAIKQNTRDSISDILHFLKNEMSAHHFQRRVTTAIFSLIGIALIIGLIGGGVYLLGTGLAIPFLLIAIITAAIMGGAIWAAVKSDKHNPVMDLLKNKHLHALKDFNPAEIKSL
jgi:hypothetical protein